jgi:hypothetical protein
VIGAKESGKPKLLGVADQALPVRPGQPVLSFDHQRYRDHQECLTFPKGDAPGMDVTHGPSPTRREVLHCSRRPGMPQCAAGYADRTLTDQATDLTPNPAPTGEGRYGAAMGEQSPRHAAICRRFLLLCERGVTSAHLSFVVADTYARAGSAFDCRLHRLDRALTLRLR